MTSGKTADGDFKMDENDEFRRADGNIPVWMVPLLSKFKMEICAEVTARVAYSVKLMLDKHLDEVRALILQQGEKWEEMTKAATCQELEAKEENKRQKKERKRKEKETKQDTTGKPSSSKPSRATWTFLEQDGFVKASEVEDHNVCLKKEEQKGKKEEKKKLKKERKRKSKEHTPEHCFVTEDPGSLRFTTEEGNGGAETERNDAETHELPEAALASADDSVSEPVAHAAPSTANEEKEASMTDCKSCDPDLQTQLPWPSHVEEMNPLPFGHSSDESPSVEHDVLPPLVVHEELHKTKARHRSASSSSGSEFEVVSMPVVITNSLHSYSSAETFVFPPGSDEDTDLDDYVNVRRKLLDDFDSLPGSSEAVAETNGEETVLDPQERGEDEVESSDKEVVPQGAGTALPQADFSVAENTDNPSGQCGEMNAASGGPPQDIPHDSASARTCRVKVFTEDFFQQVDAFEKKTLSCKTAKDAVAFVPPAQQAEILSPTRVQQSLEQAAFQNGPQNSRGRALEEALLNIPFENPHAVKGDQEPIPDDPKVTRRYPVDVPAETLWEGALTRAAQAYFTARTAVDDLSDTFSHVRQRSRRIPRRDPHSGTVMKQHCMMQLEEMGFHNQQLNVKLLEQHNYDLEIVITALVELENGW